MNDFTQAEEVNTLPAKHDPKVVGSNETGTEEIFLRHLKMATVHNA